MKSEEEIQTWLTQRIADELHISPDAVSLTKPFVRYGFDSIIIVTMGVDLEEWLGVPTDPVVFWEHPDIPTLTNWLVTEHLPNPLPR